MTFWKREDYRDEEQTDHWLSGLKIGGFYHSGAIPLDILGGMELLCILIMVVIIWLRVWHNHCIIIPKNIIFIMCKFKKNILGNQCNIECLVFSEFSLGAWNDFIFHIVLKKNSHCDSFGKVIIAFTKVCQFLIIFIYISNSVYYNWLFFSVVLFLIREHICRLPLV